MAEEEGFEPPVGLPTTVFKTVAFNRSAIPPQSICLKKTSFQPEAACLLTYLGVSIQPLNRVISIFLWWSDVRVAEGGGLLSRCTGKLVPRVRIPLAPPF